MEEWLFQIIQKELKNLILVNTILEQARHYQHNEIGCIYRMSNIVSLGIPARGPVKSIVRPRSTRNDAYL